MEETTNSEFIKLISLQSSGSYDWESSQHSEGTVYAAAENMLHINVLPATLCLHFPSREQCDYQSLGPAFQ